jgi:hypothetical protein
MSARFEPASDVSAQNGYRLLQSIPLRRGIRFSHESAAAEASDPVAVACGAARSVMQMRYMAGQVSLEKKI